MEEELMIQTDLPADQEVMEPQMVETEPKPIQVLYLTNNLILIAQIDEVLADIGQPDCKLINPCVIHGGSEKEHILTKWMSDLTPNTEMFMSSDKILTLVDPNLRLVNSYYETIK